MNSLRHAADEYLAMRRALGYSMRGQDRLLASFLDYLDQVAFIIQAIQADKMSFKFYSKDGGSLKLTMDNPMLAMSCCRRLVSAGLPAPSTIIRSASSSRRR